MALKHNDNTTKPRIIPFSLVIVAAVTILTVIWFNFNTVSGKRLVILHTNNLEGQITPIEDTVNGENVSVAGLAKIAGLIDQIKNSESNVLLFDAGDTIQGTIFTRVFRPKNIAELMNQLGFDAATIGEHDFDEGPSGLQEYIKNSNFPFIAANLDVSQSKELKDLIIPYQIFDAKGIKVGVFGLITPEAGIFAKSGSNVTILDPEKTAKKIVELLKPKSDIIILLSHLGLASDRQIATNVSNIDIIIGAHSKTKLSKPLIVRNPAEKNTIIVQAKNQGRFVGKLILAIDKPKISLVNYELIPIDSKINPSEKFQSLMKKYEEKLDSEAKKIVGKTNVDLNALKSDVRTGETNIGDLFADSVKEYFPNVDIVLINGGSIRGDKIIKKGSNISLADLWKLEPFANKIIITELTGSQIREVLERGVSSLPISKGTFLQVSGLSYSVDLTGSPQLLSSNSKEITFQGERIISIKVNGKPINPNKNYKVAVNDFMYSGGDGFVTFNKSKYALHTDKSMSELIEIYIKKHSPLNINTDGRIIVNGGLLK